MGGISVTSHERISRILEHKPVDHIGLSEHFWTDTYSEWVKQGHITPGESFELHFGLDLIETWPFNYTLDLDFVNETVAETAETITIKDGNGAILKRHKLHDTTPEHVGFTIKEAEDWYKVNNKLFADEKRINFEDYRDRRKLARDNDKFFCWSAANVFELIHPVCGHENMLIGMALEPEWIADMANQYAEVNIQMLKMLFEREGLPDGLWYYEDMGYKNKPFMSADMYCELIQPAHKKTIDFAHSLGLKVIMHSCGFIEPLLPHVIDAGIDCLNVIEIKAGMDLLKLYKLYGDKIAFMGGIDVRTLYSNDRAIIDAELESKIPIVKEGYGFILHSDHSVPKTVDYETYKYFIKKGMELGQY
jgi:uroporphyrinogen decarboxylase